MSPGVWLAFGVLASAAGWLDPVWDFAGVPLGVVPWLTTTYRVSDGQFQRRGGLLNRRQVTAPLDRVRSVDLDSDLLHRLLGALRDYGLLASRYTRPALWPGWAPQIRRVVTDAEVVAPDVTGTAKRDSGAQPGQSTPAARPSPTARGRSGAPRP